MKTVVIPNEEYTDMIGQCIHSWITSTVYTVLNKLMSVTFFIVYLWAASQTTRLPTVLDLGKTASQTTRLPTVLDLGKIAEWSHEVGSSQEYVLVEFNYIWSSKWGG